MRIIFFGTPEFAVASLDALRQAGHDVAAVVTMPDKIGGRGHKVIESDVKKYAIANNLPVLQPEKLRDPEFLDKLKSYNAELFIVIAFRMLPEVVWAMPPRGTFNLHGSLLPEFRGAAPINHAIIAGKDETGVTTFMLNHEIDAGEILMRRSTPILITDTAGTLHDRLMKIGAEVVVDTVKAIEEGTVEPLPQLDHEATAAPKIFKHTCEIDFNQPARKVYDFIRGHSPYPSAWATMVEKSGRPIEVKIPGAALSDKSAQQQAEPGTAVIIGNRLFATTADGGMIEITEIQPTGKRRMDSKAFLAGYHPAYFKSRSTESPLNESHND